MAVDHAVVSRAPRDQLGAFARRQGWHFPWYSSRGSEFNYDFGVSFTDEQIASGTVYYNFRETQFTPREAPGLSVFYRDEEDLSFSMAWLDFQFNYDETEVSP